MDQDTKGLILSSLAKTVFGAIIIVLVVVLFTWAVSVNDRLDRLENPAVPKTSTTLKQTEAIPVPVPTGSATTITTYVCHGGKTGEAEARRDGCLVKPE